MIQNNDYLTKWEWTNYFFKEWHGQSKIDKVAIGGSGHWADKVGIDRIGIGGNGNG